VTLQLVAFAHDIVDDDEDFDENLPFMAVEPRSKQKQTRRGGQRRKLNEEDALEALYTLRNELEVSSIRTHVEHCYTCTGGHSGLGQALRPWSLSVEPMQGRPECSVCLCAAGQQSDGSSQLVTCMLLVLLCVGCMQSLLPLTLVIGPAVLVLLCC